MRSQSYLHVDRPSPPPPPFSTPSLVGSYAGLFGLCRAGSLHAAVFQRKPTQQSSSPMCTAPLQKRKLPPSHHRRTQSVNGKTLR